MQANFESSGRIDADQHVLLSRWLHQELDASATAVLVLPFAQAELAQLRELLAATSQIQSRVADGQDVKEACSEFCTAAAEWQEKYSVASQQTFKQAKADVMTTLTIVVIITWGEQVFGQYEVKRVSDLAKALRLLERLETAAVSALVSKSTRDARIFKWMVRLAALRISAPGHGASCIHHISARLM